MKRLVLPLCVWVAAFMLHSQPAPAQTHPSCKGQNDDVHVHKYGDDGHCVVCGKRWETIPLVDLYRKRQP